MLVYQVQDMTCGHCAATITQAVREVDEHARVQVDLAQHRVTLEGTQAPPDALQAAISRAGYTPVPVPVPAAAAQATGITARAGGSGCCSARRVPLR